ncbi:MAG: hypothetical protein JRD89_20315 [Deltaproteobacteria bacterium]|nr:hypothetical protein [Deltaproteobacteria bacterium]
MKSGRCGRSRNAGRTRSEKEKHNFDEFWWSGMNLAGKILIGWVFLLLYALTRLTMWAFMKRREK